MGAMRVWSTAESFATVIRGSRSNDICLVWTQRWLRRSLAPPAQFAGEAVRSCYQLMSQNRPSSFRLLTSREITTNNSADGTGRAWLARPVE